MDTDPENKTRTYKETNVINIQYEGKSEQFNEDAKKKKLNWKGSLKDANEEKYLARSVDIRQIPRREGWVVWGRVESCAIDKSFRVDTKIGQVTCYKNNFNLCRIKGTENVLEYQDY